MNPSHPAALPSQRLVEAATGRAPADAVIQHGRWVCVQTGEIVEKTDIAIRDGRIAYIGPDASFAIGRNTRIIAADNRFLVPGLLDAHMHIESGMLTVTEFVRAVIPHGTTGMFVDPHEIANVLGLEGVRLMVEEAGRQPIHVFVQVPSCVPSAPGFETSGATLSLQDIKVALKWRGVIGLGEMMNFPGVSGGDEKVHREMEATRRAGKVIGGHYPSTDLGLPFSGYAAGGPQDDHEGTRQEDAVARARAGMRVMMRYGSAWHDVAEQVLAVIEQGLDPRYFLLCTDDSHSQTLVADGHMDRVIRHAIGQGVRPMTAIQMATVNTAEYFGVSRDLGLIAPGRFADVLVVPDLMDFRPELVIAKGCVAAENGSVLVELPSMVYPTSALNTVHLKRRLNPDDFRIPADEDACAHAHIIGILENQAPTRHLRRLVKIDRGEVRADIKSDIAKLAVVERHGGSGNIQMGLVEGFGLERDCAIATTVAHDCHQMLVLGTSDADMAMAANILADCGGGQVVVCDGEVIGKVELPIAGLVSNENAHIVAAKVETILEGFRYCGCRLNNPNMQLSLLALVVIPSLRMSDLGLLDVEQMIFIPLLEKS